MIKELLYKWFGVEPSLCETCEVLKIQLELERQEKKELLNLVIEQHKPTKEETKPPAELKPIMTRPIPWKVRQQALEAEDRVKAKIIKENKLEGIEELEKELDLAGTERENAKSV